MNIKIYTSNDAAVLVRWSTNTVRTEQPNGSALAPPGGQTNNYTLLGPDCIQMLISNVQLPQNNVGIHFYSLKLGQMRILHMHHVHFTSIICYIQVEIWTKTILLMSFNVQQLKEEQNLQFYSTQLRGLNVQQHVREQV